MNLKDYLHLYFGCEAVDHEGWKTTVEWSDLGYPDQIDKLILRPLSDMADEEKLTLFQIAFGTDHEYSLFGFDPVENILLADKDNRTRCAVSLKSAPVEGFRFLLSKGFDLFRLIDAGLAINATTLKTEKA